MLWVNENYAFTNGCSLTFKQENNGVRAVICFIDSDVTYSSLKENKQQAIDWAEKEFVKICFDSEGLSV